MARKTRQEQIDRELLEFEEEVHYAWTVTSNEEQQRVAYDVCIGRIGWEDIEARRVKRPALIVAAMFGVRRKMSHNSMRAKWNTANARLANKPFDAIFIGTPKIVNGRVLCVATLADGNETTSLFTLAEIRQAIKDAEQCLHTDPPSALEGAAESQDTAGG